MGALKLLQSCHFSHIPRGQEEFRNLINLQKSIKEAAEIKGAWKDNEIWIGYSLKNIQPFPRDLQEGQYYLQIRRVLFVKIS